MNKIKWEFCEALDTENILNQFEEKYKLTIPETLKEIIKNYNAGIPDKSLFDMSHGEMSFAGLLSFNPDDEETVYMVVDQFIEDGRLKMLPFATNGFGDIICTKDNAVFLWRHETASIEKISDSITGFFDMLHS